MRTIQERRKGSVDGGPGQSRRLDQSQLKEDWRNISNQTYLPLMQVRTITPARIPSVWINLEGK